MRRFALFAPAIVALCACAEGGDLSGGAGGSSDAAVDSPTEGGSGGAGGSAGSGGAAGGGGASGTGGAAGAGGAAGSGGAGGGDAGLDAGDLLACGFPVTSVACQSCVVASCCTQAQTCADDAQCLGYVVCAQACAGDSTCQSACSNAHPGGALGFLAVAGCLTASCATPCQ